MRKYGKFRPVNVRRRQKKFWHEVDRVTKKRSNGYALRSKEERILVLAMYRTRRCL